MRVLRLNIYESLSGFVLLRKGTGSPQIALIVTTPTDIAGSAGVSATMPPGIVVRPGVDPCVGFPTGTQVAASVYGYFAPDN
jgi:hypothetical protein